MNKGQPRLPFVLCFMLRSSHIVLHHCITLKQTSPISRAMLPHPASHPRIAALILAAGRSQRMTGEHKLLRKINGRALIQRASAAALHSQVQAIIVITGQQDAALRALHPAHTSPPIQFCHNPDYASGLASSLAYGIKALPADCAAVLVMLADMPDIQASHLDVLIDGFRQHTRSPDLAPIIAPTCHGQRGHPVLWPRRHFQELTQLCGDQGAKSLLQKYQDELLLLELDDPAILTDLDTSADWQAYTGQAHESS